MKKRILIVEPSDIIKAGIEAMLADTPEMVVLPSLDDCSRIEEKLIVHKPKAVIVNPTIIDSGLKFFPSSIQKKFPDVTILALVYQYISQTELSSYDGVIDIRQQKATIIDTINAAIDSKSELSKAPDTTNYELTDRETEVLILVSKGLSSKEIAEQLNISVHTVISHRKNITHKTGIKSVAGLAVYAVLNNLINSDDIND